MRKRSFPKSLLLVVPFLVMAAHAAEASDPSVPLSEEEVTLDKIKTFFDAAFLKAEFDSDGDLKIDDEGLISYIKIDAEKKLITYFSPWAMKASIPDLKKLEFINDLNDGLVLARFCMPRSTTLWCDYQLLYDGGITPYTIISNYRLFAKVVKGAIITKDTDNIVGSD
ncbi:MAG: YbjN domain-containing protein [Candidatus Eisenbacteria bacterium]|nr:YbjN domain-containing protein [Candidatus Eisenbacteria bacterium]